MIDQAFNLSDQKEDKCHSFRNSNPILSPSRDNRYKGGIMMPSDLVCTSFFEGYAPQNKLQPEIYQSEWLESVEHHHAHQNQDILMF